MLPGYTERYFTEFTTHSYPHNARIGAGAVYRIEFHFRDYSGPATELYGAETTIELSIPEKLIGVKTTEAAIRLVVQDEATLSTFYTDDDRTVLVVLRRAKDVIVNANNATFPYTFPFTFAYETTKPGYDDIFFGWLTPWDAKEPYQRAPYPIQLSATCGLGSLQDFEYDATPGNNTIHDIFYNCLLKTGFELPLYQASYIYEESHLENGNIPNLEFDALKHTRLNTQGFIQNGQRRSCYDVLADFCQANYVLLQWAGAWHLVRLEHQIDFAGQFVYLKYANAADENPTTQVGDIRKDVFLDKDLLPLDGSMLGVQASIKVVEVTAEYGGLINQLRNGFFVSGINSWTVNNNTFHPLAGLIALPSPVGDGTEQNPYALKITGSAYNSALNTISYLLGFWSFKQTVNVSRTVRPVSTTRTGQPGPATNQERHALSISVNFVNYYCTGPLVVVEVNTSQGRHYLTSDGGYTKKIKDGQLTFDNTFRAPSGQLQAKPTKGETFTITATEPIPGLGAYTVTMYFFQGTPLETSSPNAAIEYRRAFLSIDDNSTIVAVREVITIQPDNLDARARKRKESITVSFGDQTTWHAGAGQRYNALLRVDGTPTLRWVMNTLTGTLRDKWQNLVARGYYRMMGSQGTVFDGEVLGDLGPLDLPRFPELNNIIMRPDTWRWDVNARRVQTRAVEVLDNRATMQVTGRWESEDGTPYPMPADAADMSPTSPPTVYLPRQNTGGLASNNLIEAVQRSAQLLVPNRAIQVPKDYNEGSTVVATIRRLADNGILRYGGK